MKYPLLILSVFAVAVLFALCRASDCGVERITVKSLADSDTLFLRNPPVLATIQELRAIPPVKENSITPRMKCEERTVILHCFILGFKLETDGDIHIGIGDSSGRTMIAEIPSPLCPEVEHSAKLKEISETRKAFIARFGEPTKVFKKCNVPAVLTGVVFMDHVHGQVDHAPNACEIHPLLSVSFGANQ